MNVSYSLFKGEIHVEKSNKINEIYHGQSSLINPNTGKTVKITSSTQSIDTNMHEIASKNPIRKIQSRKEAPSKHLPTISAQTVVKLVEMEPPQTFTESHAMLQSERSNAGSGLLLPPLKKRKIEIISQKFFLHKEIQTELTSGDIDALFLYYKNAVEERKELLFKISNLVIDVDFFKDNDKKTRFYTGLTTWSLLKNFFELVKDYIPNHFNSKLSPFQILVMTLMKLRLNFNFTDLGYRFQVDRKTISNNFHRCIHILFKLFHTSKVLRWPERESIVLNTPSYFRSAYKEQIVIIIDCFEIVIERAGNLRALAQSYSTYKHRTTIKFLIGITTTGVIIFISDAFGGRASDKFITIKSDLLDNLRDGDVVLADKGFLIESEVEARGASLIMPSFIRNGNQLHPVEVEESRHASSIRIHVERVISTLRQKFNICSDLAPMSAISKHNDLFDNDLYSIIVFLCCSLINLCPSVVSNDFEI